MESVRAVRMQCGSSGGDGKTCKHTKYECLIPLMGCGSGMACSCIVECLPHHGVIHAEAAQPPQWKMGVVCIPAKSSFVCSLFFCCCYVGLLSTATEASKMTATIMKDNYEKLNSSCMRM